MPPAPATKSKPRQVEQTKRMREQGYIPIDEAATRSGLNRQTIWQYVGRDRVVAGKKLGHKWFVHLGSLVQKIGVEESVMIGLINEEQAEQLRKKSNKKK